MRILLLVAALSLLSCHRQTGPVRAVGLAGLTLPLIPSPAVRIGLPGLVNEAPALIEVDVTSPVTFVATGCLEGGIDAMGTTEYVEILGRPRAVTLARAPEIVVGDRLIRLAAVGLITDEFCAVSLGSDVLSHVAMTVDPHLRTVHFEASRTRAQWETQLATSGTDSQLLTLTREPRFDWPLLTVRLTQGTQSTAGTFALSTLLPLTEVFEGPLKAANLTVLHLPKASQNEEHTSRGAVMIDALELSPGRVIDVGALRTVNGTVPHGVMGLLGPDVWSQFTTTIDIGSDVLVLQQPKVAKSGNSIECTGANGSSQEACFSLEAVHTAAGMLTTASIQRPVKEGLRLWLEIDAPDAQACRVGFTIAPSGHAVTTQHLLPWERLKKSLPACASALSKATSAKFGMVEEGFLPECTGTCAFVNDIRSGQISCECQPGPAGFSPEQLEVMRGAVKSEHRHEELIEEPKDP